MIRIFLTIIFNPEKPQGLKPWGFLIPYLHMIKRLSWVLDHTEAQGSGNAGDLGVGDAGAIQVGGVAVHVPGVFYTAHLGVAGLTANAANLFTDRSLKPFFDTFIYLSNKILTNLTSITFILFMSFAFY